MYFLFKVLSTNLNLRTNFNCERYLIIPGSVCSSFKICQHYCIVVRKSNKRCCNSDSFWQIKPAVGFQMQAFVPWD